MICDNGQWHIKHERDCDAQYVRAFGGAKLARVSWWYYLFNCLSALLVNEKLEAGDVGNFRNVIRKSLKLHPSADVAKLSGKVHVTC